MDPKSIRLLKFLEAVESNCGASQRALAEDLRISLGLVNASFRKLAAAGILKTSSNSRGHVKYGLTRKGLHEKARLTYEHLLSSYRLYKDAIERLVGFFTDLEAGNVRRLVFLGVSDFTEMAYLGMKETSLDMVAVVDDRKMGQRFFERTVESPSVLEDLSFDRLLVTDPGVGVRDSARKVIAETGPGKVIFAPFCPSIAHDTWSSI
jgi:DNA-binding Lrp family transcriptional regulator